MQSREPDNTLAGIKLILGEIRDLRLDLARNSKRVDEDRRRSDVRFEQMREDSKRRHSELLQGFIALAEDNGHNGNGRRPHS